MSYAQAREIIDKFAGRLKEPFDTAKDKLRELDPTVKDSEVREVLRNFDHDTIKPIVDKLKLKLIPPVFDAYIADLERQPNSAADFPQRFFSPACQQNTG